MDPATNFSEFQEMQALFSSLGLSLDDFSITTVRDCSWEKLREYLLLKQKERELLLKGAYESKEAYLRAKSFTQLPKTFHELFGASAGKRKERNHEANNKPKKGKGQKSFSQECSALLKHWLFEHMVYFAETPLDIFQQNPYPTEEEKEELSKLTGLSIPQINQWFINARRRTLPLLLEFLGSKEQATHPEFYNHNAEFQQAMNELRNTNDQECEDFLNEDQGKREVDLEENMEVLMQQDLLSLQNLTVEEVEVLNSVVPLKRVDPPSFTQYNSISQDMQDSSIDFGMEQEDDMLKWLFEAQPAENQQSWQFQ